MQNSDLTLAMRWAMPRAVALAVMVSIVCAATGALAQKPESIPEEVEWTWEVRPPHPDAKLPNVLLLGDSITRNYFPQVTKDLVGVANIYLMSSSTSVGDPRLPQQITEFALLEKVHFRVVHFNNGMHGWGYTEGQFKTAFPLLVETARAPVGADGVAIWGNITPVKADKPDGATNARIDQRNAIAFSFVNAEKIPVDDLHALMLKHADTYDDLVHFNTTGANLMGDQVAAMIRALLAK